MKPNEIEFFVDLEIEREFRGHPAVTAMSNRVVTFNSNAISIFEDPILNWNDKAKFNVIVLPGDKLNSSFVPTEMAKQKILNGSSRLVFMNASRVTGYSFPITVFPENINESSSQFLLNQLCRTSGWGLQTVMPAGSKILTERINNENQISKKIDQSIEFIKVANPLMKNRTLAIRATLTTFFLQHYPLQLKIGVNLQRPIK